MTTSPGEHHRSAAPSWWPMLVPLQRLPPVKQPPMWCCRARAKLLFVQRSRPRCPDRYDWRQRCWHERMTLDRALRSSVLRFVCQLLMRRCPVHPHPRRCRWTCFWICSCPSNVDEVQFCCCVVQYCEQGFCGRNTHSQRYECRSLHGVQLIWCGKSVLLSAFTCELIAAVRYHFSFTRNDRTIWTHN